MDWTKEVPTVPGLYWVSSLIRVNSPYVVEVSGAFGGGLGVLETGCEEMASPEQYSDDGHTYWYGPLTPPPGLVTSDIPYK